MCQEPLYDLEPDPDDLLDVHNVAAYGEDIPPEAGTPPEEQTEAADDQQEPAEERKRTGLAITIASVPALLIAGIVLTSIFSARQDDRDPPPARKNRVASAPPELLPVTQPADDDPAVPPVAADGAPPDQDLPESGVNVRIDVPQGAHTVEVVKGADRFQLSGKVKKLVIGGVDNEGVLATEKLAVEEVVITGDVKGAGALKLNVPGGSVTFLGALDGACRVRVNAPGGKVTFGSADKSRRGGGNIVGSAHVTIIARDVDLRGVLDGGARVTVTLTEAGSLRFAMIAGGARLHYRTAKRGAPDPKIERGGIIGGGKFARVE